MKLTDTTGIIGKVRYITTDSRTRKLLRVSEWSKNLVVRGTDTGKDIILDRMAGVNTYSLNITHADIGTGSTAPTNSDTALETAVRREAKTLATVSGNTLTLSFFFSDANLPDGTYNEFGTFVDGSTGTGTGQLFNRVVLSSPLVKATGQDNTIEVIFTVE